MNKPLTKSELASALAEATDTTKAAAAKSIDALMGLVSSQLAEGNEVVLPGIGKLLVKERAARTVRNPLGGGTLDKPADKAVKFRPAKGLKDAVNA